MNTEGVGSIGSPSVITEPRAVMPAGAERLPESEESPRLERIRVDHLIRQANARLQRNPRTRNMEFVPIDYAGKIMVQLQQEGRPLQQYPAEKILKTGPMLQEVGMVYRTKA